MATITVNLPEWVSRPFHNWKTTAAGQIGASGVMWAFKYDFLRPHPDISHCVGIFLFAAGLSLLGASAHDGGVPSASTLEALGVPTVNKTGELNP